MKFVNIFIIFSRAVRENFGQFSKERSMKLSNSKEQIRPAILLASEHGMKNKVRNSIYLKSGIRHAVHTNLVHQSAPCDVLCHKIST